MRHSLTAISSTLIGLYLLILASSLTRPQLLPNYTFHPLTTHRAYLPIVTRDYCATKCWSGVHLGNRTNDWPGATLQRIDPNQGGQWPRAVVFLSDQVYEIHRYPRTNPYYPCQVWYALPRSDRPIIFDYIRRAAQAGVRLIIRIYPSPGNFIDWDDPAHQNHHLSPGPPVGLDGYCRPDLYRSKGDIGDEIGAIHNLNLANGFTEFGFEPANEPNAEWYTFNSSPAVFNRIAWEEMDIYFSAIYDWVHTYYSPNIRVLTPPMAQSLYAEEIDIADVFTPPLCEPRRLIEGGTGYDTMVNTYGIKNDGIDWHNYWILDKEDYALCPYGQHVSIYFPQWLKDVIHDNQKPTTVGEADLASPWQGMGNPLPDKTSGNNPELAADSIRFFFWSEWYFGGGYHYGVRPSVNSWLLTDNTGNPEHDWHEAYYSGGLEHDWFRLWYTGDEY